MVFAEQTISQFLAAKNEASKFLQQTTELERSLFHTEAFILQAAGHILTYSGVFRELEIKEYTQLSNMGVSGPMRRFVRMELFIPEWGRTTGRGTQPRVYSPTDLGAQTLAFFQVET